MNEDRKKQLQDFLLSSNGNLGKILNSDQAIVDDENPDYEQMTATAQEGPGQNKRNLEQYLGGAGDLEVPQEQQQDIANRLEERKRQKTLLKKAAAQIFTGNEAQLISTAAKLGTSLGSSIGRDKFSQTIIMLLAITDDFLDNIDFFFANITLGSIGTLLSIAIFIILLKVAWGKQSGVRRFIKKQIIIFIIDNLLSIIFPFAPATTIGNILLIKQEIKIAKQEDRIQEENIEKAKKNVKQKSKHLRESELNQAIGI